mmetsp:Transcript_21917/g.55377  ORF Transcript_21917/g.55377 Transcript_21917/m.55377 type:complete len:222 (-) Transcript_21917:366-1031(-)
MQDRRVLPHELFAGITVPLLVHCRQHKSLLGQPADLQARPHVLPVLVDAILVPPHLFSEPRINVGACYHLVVAVARLTKGVVAPCRPAQVLGVERWFGQIPPGVRLPVEHSHLDGHLARLGVLTAEQRLSGHSHTERLGLHVPVGAAQQSRDAVPGQYCLAHGLVPACAVVVVDPDDKVPLVLALPVCLKLDFTRRPLRRPIVPLHRCADVVFAEADLAVE